MRDRRDGDTRSARKLRNPLAARTQRQGRRNERHPGGTRHKQLFKQHPREHSRGSAAPEPAPPPD